MDTEDFINKPVNALGLNGQFCDQCTAMGFTTMAGILATAPEVLTKMDGFSYQWLADLTEALNKEGLLHLLQPLPGSIRG